MLYSSIEAETRTRQHDLARKLQNYQRRGEFRADSEEAARASGQGLRGRLLFAMGGLLVSVGLSLKARCTPDSLTPTVG